MSLTKNPGETFFFPSSSFSSRQIFLASFLRPLLCLNSVLTYNCHPGAVLHTPLSSLPHPNSPLSLYLSQPSLSPPPSSSKIDWREWVKRFFTCRNEGRCRPPVTYYLFNLHFEPRIHFMRGLRESWNPHSARLSYKNLSSHDSATWRLLVSFYKTNIASGEGSCFGGVSLSSAWNGRVWCNLYQ